MIIALNYFNKMIEQSKPQIALKFLSLLACCSACSKHDQSNMLSSFNWADFHMVQSLWRLEQPPKLLCTDGNICYQFQTQVNEVKSIIN